jgi:ADP-ribose pyrophosphatase
LDHLKEKTLSTTPLYKGKVIDVSLQEVELPDGKKSKREIVNHPGAVAVIAQTDDGKIVFVRQYRKPLERTIVEIPAGKLEKGEKPEVTARRELVEETGYTCENMEHIISFYTSPGFADELVHLYYASGLKAGPQQAEEDEFLDVLELTLEEAEKLEKSQDIYDAKTSYALLYLKIQQK